MTQFAHAPKRGPLIVGLLSVALATSLVIAEHHIQESDLLFLSGLERSLLDFRFRLRGPKKVSGQVGVLAIDDTSI